MAQRADAAVHLTVEQFLTYDAPEGKAELVRGELRMIPPPGGRHSIIIVRLAARLLAYVEANRLGVVLANGGFELFALPRTIRAPDIAFLSASRVPSGGIGPGLVRATPDLAVEIVSPSETATRLDEKLDDYRAAGVPLVWVIDPERRVAMIVSGDQPVRWVRENESLQGGKTLPNFSCRLGELFEGTTD